MVKNHKKIIKKRINTLSDLDDIVKKLWEFRNQCAIYTLSGPLGVGKTTLVRKFLYYVGVQGVISSPTFTYVNVYKNGHGQIFYHFDLYRIESQDFFIQNGFDEYLYQPHSWAFIEWPEIIQPLLFEKVCNISLDYEKTNKRILSYTFL